MTLFLAVLTPFFGAALVALAAHFGRVRAAWTAGAVTLTALALLAPLFPLPFAGDTLIQQHDWVPALGLNLAFRLDGLALLFAGLILGIGLLIVVYARYYLSPRDSMGRFYAYLMLFMGSMLGIVLSENLIQLVVFWELTSLSSFLLISYWQHREEARQGARMALAVTGLGGFALLGGVLLLGHIVGSYELSDVFAAREMIRTHPLYGPTLTLILLGVFTKSAQFPFHFWLPHAMAAPTPVSAYLHSATMVKAGVFLLARLYPALSGTPEWFWLVSGAGLATLLLGAYVALFKHDLKGLLAYSTISHLGLITLLFGMSTPLAAVAGVFHIINHATFKASLFMAAGIIDHEAGTRDLRRLSGLWHYMPYTATLAMVAAAAMAGVPLLNGFLSKEMFFAEAALLSEHRLGGWVFPALVTLAGALAVAYSLRFIHQVFFNGKPTDLPRTPHEPPRWMKVPVEILVVLCLVVGIVPAPTVGPLLAVAAAGTLQAPLPEYHLALWHGLNPALAMSLLALAGGVTIYRLRRPLFALQERYLERVDARVAYNMLLQGLFSLSGWITRALDTGALQRQVFLVLLAALGLGVAPWLGSTTPLTGTRAGLALDPVSLLAGASLVVAAFATVWYHRQRLVALITLGVVGLVVALIFVKFSAPDLALTQLSVEVVTIVLLLLALYFLPERAARERDAARLWRDGALALVAGGGAALLAWAVLTRPYETIAGYFIANSVPGGGGKNVVNVILVDFRGYDTLGEITVLALAGLGIYALLDTLRLDAPDRDSAGRAWDRDRHPLIMATLSRLLLPLALLVAVFILLRGHNQPGGGFIAGLVTAVALILQYLARGSTHLHERFPASTQPLIAAGLGLATLTGLASWAFGYPFLTSTFGHLVWPVVGDFELASAMAFDLGVFLVVVGATLLILVKLGALHDSRIRKARR
ncbi:NADH dehydrogenase (quinone) [Thiobacillus denitrificans ATCC 25259]|uniref:NADH dehydrogenase (Quinone) n=1 Tax=Thiobacillus denitrificans (strain ATCC 25259 / T1) TaxID=292415 RepID=Q3SLG1_THIDA|nr:monovalent cation/H+ antiporter subunit A [Thiobacillus denitrificans]AAZ96450.1 NADH dehydrogenase (quinone) [Thiobacillus denitrificans ATCC 25259]